jgi:ADP-ribose pyrophosphatase YjhB (NUDIX family)
MNQPRLTIVCAPHLILIRDTNVLLGKRCNTGYADGFWHVPGGHMEKGENILDALIREMEEEIGIQIDPTGIDLAHAVHDNGTNEGRMQMFFTIQDWDGEIENKEPEKCEGLDWFPIDNLPEKTVPYAKQAIELSQKGVRFSLMGWEKEVRVGN